MSVVELASEERPRSRWLVLLSPTGAFTAVRERPLAWRTLVVVSLLAAVPALAFVSAVDMLDFLLAQLKDSGRLEEMPEEALAFVRKWVAPGMTYGLPLAAVASRAASILVVATLGFAFLRGVSKELAFKACLAAVALAMAPLVVQDLLRALLFVVRDLRDLDVKNPVLSNPAAWLGLDTERSALGALLRGLDLFELWAAWLGAYGLNVVARARSSLPYALTFGGQALLTLAAVMGVLVGGAVS